MTRTQLAVLVSPVILIATMLPVFRLAAAWAGPDAGWCIGMAVYWVVWCAGFSSWVLGRNKVRGFFRPRTLTWEAALLVLLPVAMAAGFRWATSTAYSKPNLWATMGWVFSAVANGCLEENL